jgi:hypothetical protein
MTKPLDSDELWAVVITRLPFGGVRCAIWDQTRISQDQEAEDWDPFDGPSFTQMRPNVLRASE